MGWVFILLQVSGNPSILSLGRQVVLAITAGMCLWALVKKRAWATDLQSQVAAAVFGLLFIIQSITFDDTSLITVAGFITRVFIGYAILRLVHDFAASYIKTMVCIAVLSWPFYMVDSLTGGSLRLMLQPVDLIKDVGYVTYVGIHTFHIDSYRNCGLFWEPGAFAAYLLLAILLLGYTRQNYTNKQFSVILAILAITTISTTSTGGLIILPVVLLVLLWLTTRNTAESWRRITVGLVLIGGCYATLYSISPIREKVLHQYDKVLYGSGRWELTRFGTLVSDSEYIREKPLFGWGLHSETRYALHGGITVQGQGNSLSDFTVKFGIIGMLTYLTCVYLGIGRMSGCSRLQAGAFAVCIALILNMEALLNHPCFLGLMFLGSTSITREASESSASLTIPIHPLNT